MANNLQGGSRPKETENTDYRDLAQYGEGVHQERQHSANHGCFDKRLHTDSYFYQSKYNVAASSMPSKDLTEGQAKWQFLRGRMSEGGRMRPGRITQKHGRARRTAAQLGLASNLFRLPPAVECGRVNSKLGGHPSQVVAAGLQKLPCHFQFLLAIERERPAIG